MNFFNATTKGSSKFVFPKKEGNHEEELPLTIDR
jgi:hypothetical protein